MVSELREKKKPNYFRFIRESILENLSVTVFHSGQPCCRQKTLTAGDFPAKSFSNTDHTIRCARRRSSSFVKAPEGESQSRADHARFFSGGLNLRRWHVEHFPATRFHLQPNLTPSSHFPSVLVPSESCKCIFWGFCLCRLSKHPFRRPSVTSSPPQALHVS